MASELRPVGQDSPDRIRLVPAAGGILAGGRRRAAGLVVLIAVVALSGVALPVTSVNIITESLQFAVLACATNLLVGYGGLVSFGQGAFYGTGAYVIALTWLHLRLNFWVAFIGAPFVAAAAALLIGMIAVRTRGLYFALLTLAFAQLFNTVALLQTGFTNGSTGVFGQLIPAALTSPRTAFFFVLGVTVVALAVLWWITVSPFGLTLRAIRENPGRVQALGVNLFRHQLLAFVISGFFCGLAGALFVVYDNAAYPDLLNWIYSGYPVFMAVIGGMFAFLGPALGAFIYTAGYTIINNTTSDWQLIFGALLLLIALFAPNGLVGMFRRGRGGTTALQALGQWLRLPVRARRPGSPAGRRSAPHEGAPHEGGPPETGPGPETGEPELDRSGEVS